MSKRLRARVALSSSVFALCVLPGWAHASCTPDPTVRNGQTICSGIDADGLAVTTSGTSVIVEQGATVRSGDRPAGISFSDSGSLIVSGTIDGGDTAGVLITNGVPYYGRVDDPYAGTSPQWGLPRYGMIYPGTSILVSIAAGAAIKGASAITLAPRPDNPSGAINLGLENSGMLIGTAGPALVAQGGAMTIGNAETGFIGGISGHFGNIVNLGIIDGGTGAAISSDAMGQVGNEATGTIRSASDAATISLAGAGINNRGSIENTGQGVAIASTDSVILYNFTGGRIRSAGGTAIVADGRLYLDNQGEIIGSIDNRRSSESAMVDTSSGSIAGDVLLGSGDDLFIGGDFDPTLGRFSNVTGTIDGGAGIDTVAFAVASDTILGRTGMPLNFERAQLLLDNGARVEVGEAFDISHGLVVGGTGTLVINRNAAVNGPLLTTSYIRYPAEVNLVTNGALTSTLSNPGDFAVDLGLLGVGTNSGTIVANGGGGLRLQVVNAYAEGRGFTNDGTIVADGTAVQISGKLINSGIIRSNSDVGVINTFSGGGLRGLASINSGTIEGRTAGVRIDSTYFVNSGTITASAGMGVDLGYNAGFDNLAGGVVNGTTVAIGTSSFTSKGVVRNAGTINGDVRFIAAENYFDGSNDIFVDNGGVVNGNLLLGGGDDHLIVDLGRQGSLAGVTGTVDAGAGYDTIRYRVRGNGEAVVAAPAGFEAVGYELTDGGALNLSSPDAQTLGVTIGGIGSVTLAADLRQTNHVVLDLDPLTTGQLTGDGDELRNNLDVVSKGRLSLTSLDNYGYPPFVAVNAGTARFENAGTIEVTGSGGWYQPFAIFNGSEIVNSGQILLDGASAIAGAVKVVNSGTIVQRAGSAASTGLSNVGNVENSGTISVDGIALSTRYGPATIRNGGLIESRKEMAIVTDSGTIINQSTGTISGAEVAIYGGSFTKVVNAGTIRGDVILGGPYASFASGTYVADGGRLDGDLLFSSGNDVLLARDGVTGVTGKIDAGGGYDIFGRFYTRSTDTAVGGPLPETFEGERVEAIGADTAVTLTGSDGVERRGLQVAGDGRIVNRADIAGSVVALPDGSVAADGIGVLAAFTNEARLGGGFSGVVKSFVNNGRVDGSVELSLDRATVENRGRIDGDVRLFGADSRFDFFQGSSVSGTVRATSGTNQLAFHLADDGGAPQSIDLRPYQGFQRLSLESGTGTLAGYVGFDRIDVNDGRLIGLAGSVISAPDGIGVARNAVFGSAGTVNGTIVVNGTLSPGASPGTMTVNGNVTLAAGSTSLFEMGPVASDALIVNGKLGIADGAVLRLTGTRPVTPGVTYDLITASGGIGGQFASIDQAPTIAGVIRRTGDRIRLLGQFLLASPANRQATTTVTYVNGLLAAGTASSGLLAAAPSMVDADGYASQVLFQRISPEAYASALQIGIENGLALSGSLRSFGIDRAAAGSGWFGFGQAFGTWRRLPGDHAIGSSTANIRSTGAFGGIGYGTGGVSIGAFVGRVDTRQNIAALGASNDADGVVAGMIASASPGDFDISLGVAYDGSNADTNRPTLSGSTSRGRYSLHGWTADVAAGYRFALGGGWSLRPQLGYTHIRTRRGQVVETGGGAFGLAVAGRALKADFISGELALGSDTAKSVRAWLSGGLRYQLGGKATIATAGFVGNAEVMTVEGGARDPVLGTMAAGIAVDVAPSVTLGLNGRTEFGADSSAAGGNLSIRIQF